MPFFFELPLLDSFPCVPGRSREEGTGVFAPEWGYRFLMLVRYPREIPKIQTLAAPRSEVVRVAFVHGASLPRKMKIDLRVCDEPVTEFSAGGAH